MGVNTLRTALKLAGALAVPLQDTALPLELVDAHGRQVGGAMLLGRVVVRFVHGDSGVDHFGLDHFLLEDGLDGLVNVAGEDSVSFRRDCFLPTEQDLLVNMFAFDNRSAALGVLGVVDDALVAELGLLGLQSPLGLLIFAVVKLAVYYAANIVPVLFGKDLTVLDGLHLAMVVVLVYFFVDGGVDLLVPGGLDSLVLHCRGNLLVDSGIMVTSLGHEVLDCLLFGVHCRAMGCWVKVVDRMTVSSLAW